MLLEFSVTNYRSIGVKQTLSMLPAPKQKDYVGNILTSAGYTALNAAALYGANASGKSNFLRAMNLMDFIIHTSSRLPSTAKLPYDPFLLREGYESMPTVFEIVFVHNDIRYRYGFSYDKSTIQKEWLYRKNVSREVVLFLRESDIIDVRSSFCSKKSLVDTVIDATRDNALFLSQSDAFNIEEARQVLVWFDSFVMINGLKTEVHESKTIELWKNQSNRKIINSYLNEIAIDIEGVNVLTMDSKDVLSATDKAENTTISEFEIYNIQSIHTTYDRYGNPKENKVSWDFQDHESEGSIKTLQMTGPIIWTLSNGGVLIIDEIEAKLHPILTLNIIDMFLDANVNKKKAQLIFATHDTNLLSYAKLRRDQIYFCEKNKWKSSELFSLSDFVYFNERDGSVTEEKERKDSDKERRYMEGRYGAIPVLGKFKDNVMNILWHEKED